MSEVKWSYDRDLKWMMNSRTQELRVGKFEDVGQWKKQKPIRREKREIAEIPPLLKWRDLNEAVELRIRLIITNDY